MQLNIFLIIFVLLIIKPVVTAQFLSVIGVERLPLVFLLVAVVAMGVSTIYSQALLRRSIRRLTSTTLIISIVSLIIIGFLLHFNIAEVPVLYMFYIGVAIFGVLTTSQFWIMANLAFDAREAKRVFGFIGAGPIAGGVAGGYATSFLANYFDAPLLLFIAAILLSLCIPLNDFIWRKHIKPLTDIQRHRRLKGFGEHPLWLISRSKHMTYLAILVGISVVVTKLVDYQFNSIASDAISDPDDLTAFFGFWFSTFNVVSLLIQLFLTRRIVGTYGVGTSLFALPAGIMLGSVVLLFSPVLWAGVFTKLWDVSVKQSVNKAATELLALPIPASIKSQTKSFIDVFVDMAATGVGGILLIIVINGMELSVEAVSILTIMTVGVWFWVALRVRKEYVNSFRSKLTQADLRSNKELPNLKSASVMNGLKRALDEGSENQIMYVLQKVQEVPDKRMFDDVARFLDHSSAAVRAQALQCIYYLQKTVDTDKLDQLMHDPEMDVRYKAFSQLLRQTKDQRMVLMQQYLLADDPKMSGAALVSLAEESRNNPEMQRMLKLEQRIREKADYIDLTEDPDERKLYQRMVLRAAGHAKLDSFHPFIQRYMEHSDPELKAEAMRAAGATGHECFIERLIDLLVTTDTRKEAQNALIDYGVGVIPKLQAAALEPSATSGVVRHIPALLERIDAQQAVNALVAMLNSADATLRFEALRSLNAIKRDFPHLKIRKKDVVLHIIEETDLYRRILGVLYLQDQKKHESEGDAIRSSRVRLIELLERRMDGTLERIFRLLGLRYPPDEVIPVYDGIRSVDPNVRLNSVEFLDNLLDPSLKRMLIPIAETSLLDTITDETIDQLNVPLFDEEGCIRELLKGRDPKLKIAVFELIEAMNIKEHAELVKPFLDSPVARVREHAQRTLSAISS